MINLAQVLGRVGKIETITTSTGTKITKISLVTSKKFNKNGEKIEKVTWHNISLFSKLSDVAESYVSVGDLLYVQGELDNSKYMAQDGTERIRSGIIAHDIKLMPKAKEHTSPQAANGNVANEFMDDGIPF